MADLTPNNREEYWLQGMVDGQTTLEPNERREYWYKEIVDAIGSGGGGGTGGGGYDAVITLNYDTTGGVNHTAEIVSGTFNEVYTKAITSKLPINIAVNVVFERDGEMCICSLSGSSTAYSGEPALISYGGVEVGMQSNNFDALMVALFDWLETGIEGITIIDRI